MIKFAASLFGAVKAIVQAVSGYILYRAGKSQAQAEMLKSQDKLRKKEIELLNRMKDEHQRLREEGEKRRQTLYDDPNQIFRS